MDTEVVVAIIGSITAVATVGIQLRVQRQNRSDHGGVREEVIGLRADIKDVKADIHDVKADVREVKRDTTATHHRIDELEKRYVPPAQTINVTTAATPPAA